MTISSVWIHDFRCFEEARIQPDPHGLTVFHGANGAGKTSILEAVGWLATTRSIRGAGRDTVVRRGAQSAILRAETTVVGHGATIELEIALERPGRTLLNRQVVRRRSELGEALRVSVFSPADRVLVEGGPAERRNFLDDVLGGRNQRLEALVDEVGHVLRQRAALLRQSAGQLRGDLASTLEVWDSRLATSGAELVSERERLTEDLEPLVSDFYSQLARSEDRVSLGYIRSWNGDLQSALTAARTDDLRRQATTVGPHRDEVEITIGTNPARTHGSQGEQRCIAIALKLAMHELARRSSPESPVLLLDDVFSELDARRSAALVGLLPPGQVLLTTASEPPALVETDRVVEVSRGELAVVAT